MKYAGRITLAQRLSYLFLGFVLAAALVPPFWLTWGRDAVEIGAKAACKEPEVSATQRAEMCMAFWFNSEPTEKFDAMKRMCPRARDSRKTR